MGLSSPRFVGKCRELALWGIVFKGHSEKTTPNKQAPIHTLFSYKTRKNSLSIVFIKCFHIHDLSFCFNLILQVRCILSSLNKEMGVKRVS